MLICIEGVTNSGKTSLCNWILSHNEYYMNLFTPNTIIHNNIRKITHPVQNVNSFCTETELMLYCALLSDKANQIKKMHGNILLDRFSLSVFAYFRARYGIDDIFLKKLVNISSMNIIPDITFFLDVSLNTIMDRARSSPFSRKDMEIEEYFNELKKNYIEYINIFSKKFYILDGEQDIDSIGRIVYKKIANILS